MSLLDRAGCVREMTESRRALQERFDVPALTFAYPFCRYGPDAVAAAREAGFVAAVTCEGRGGWEPYELRRAMITGKDGMPSFLLKLADVYHPAVEQPSRPGAAHRHARCARPHTRGDRALATRLRWGASWSACRARGPARPSWAAPSSSRTSSGSWCDRG